MAFSAPGPWIMAQGVPARAPSGGWGGWGRGGGPGALRQGADLAILRDRGEKDCFDDMPATEPRAFEDFDCTRLQKRYEDLRIQKPGHSGRKIL